MALFRNSTPFCIKPFVWEDWSALWRIRIHQLAEHGIHVDLQAIPSTPEDVGPDDPEWDLHHMKVIYLAGAGHFWLAWDAANPIGYVGAHDAGGALEIRRMYVQDIYRRRGIGRQLMQSVLEHAKRHGVSIIELWTEEDGPGRALYRTLGFCPTAAPGVEFAVDRSRPNTYTPRPHDLRMRLDIKS